MRGLLREERDLPSSPLVRKRAAVRHYQTAKHRSHVDLKSNKIPLLLSFDPRPLNYSRLAASWWISNLRHIPRAAGRNLDPALWSDPGLDRLHASRMSRGAPRPGSRGVSATAAPLSWRSAARTRRSVAPSAGQRLAAGFVNARASAQGHLLATPAGPMQKSAMG